MFGKKSNYGIKERTKQSWAEFYLAKKNIVLSKCISLNFKSQRSDRKARKLGQGQLVSDRAHFQNKEMICRNFCGRNLLVWIEFVTWAHLGISILLINKWFSMSRLHGNIASGCLVRIDAFVQGFNFHCRYPENDATIFLFFLLKSKHQIMKSRQISFNWKELFWSTGVFPIIGTLCQNEIRCTISWLGRACIGYQGTWFGVIWCKILCNFYWPNSVMLPKRFLSFPNGRNWIRRMTQTLTADIEVAWL